jgi:hypothetical protein
MKRAYIRPLLEVYQIKSALLGSVSGYGLENFDVILPYGGVDSKGELVPE